MTTTQIKSMTHAQTMEFISWVFFYRVYIGVESYILVNHIYDCFGLDDMNGEPVIKLPPDDVITLMKRLDVEQVLFNCRNYIHVEWLLQYFGIPF